MAILGWLDFAPLCVARLTPTPQFASTNPVIYSMKYAYNVADGSIVEHRYSDTECMTSLSNSTVGNVVLSVLSLV